MGNTNTTNPLYRRKIDIQGNYLPFSGYTIISHAIHPLPKPFADLIDYLSSSELQKYYSFLPTTSYHVTINPLENVREEHKSLLQEEQRKLIAQDTSIICTTKKLIRTKVLLIEVQFKNDYENLIQNVRSIELQQAGILHEYVLSCHLTLAYQYKDIENDEIKLRLDKLIENIPQSSTFPFDIPLDQIRICYYNDLTKFIPI